MNRVSSFGCYLLGWSHTPIRRGRCQFGQKSVSSGTKPDLQQFCFVVSNENTSSFRHHSVEGAMNYERNRKWLEVKVPECTHDRRRLRSHLPNFLTEKPAVRFASQSSITDATNSAKNNAALACLIMPMPSALCNSKKSSTKCYRDWRPRSPLSQPLCLISLWSTHRWEQTTTCQLFWKQWMDQVLMRPPRSKSNHVYSTDAKRHGFQGAMPAEGSTTGYCNFRNSLP